MSVGDGLRLANVTAVIATLNRPSALERCLHALLSGEQVPAEIVIVDQSDGDETEAVVGKSRTPDVEIVYVRQRRRGLSASRNAAIARASCPVIAITDDDCVPDKRWIRTIQ